VTLRGEKFWPFLAGLLLSVNLYLLPFLPTSPRATDLGGVVLGAWVILRLARGRIKPLSLAILGVIAITPVIWMFFSVLNGDSRTGVLTARWLLGLPWAAALLLMAEAEDRLDSFAWGLLVGGLVNVLVIVLQWLGFESILQMVGLSSSGANYTQFVSHQVRIPGLHGHHNASSSVTSLMVPAGFFLYFRGRINLAALLACMVGFLLCLHLTSTRSPLLVMVSTIVFASVLARRMRLSIVLGLVVLVFLVPLVAVYGPPGGWARWKNTEALVSNASERQDSGLGALELSLDHPLGLGVAQGQIKLVERTGIRAAHNAFLQAALVWGLPLGLLLLVGLVSTVLAGFGGEMGEPFLTSLLAIHLCGLFMFEEHLNNPTFIVLAAWLMAAALYRKLRTGKSPAGWPTHNPR
jgi:hypothetical protein